MASPRGDCCTFDFRGRASQLAGIRCHRDSALRGVRVYLPFRLVYRQKRAHPARNRAASYRGALAGSGARELLLDGVRLGISGLPFENLRVSRTGPAVFFTSPNTLRRRVSALHALRSLPLRNPLAASLAGSGSSHFGNQHPCARCGVESPESPDQSALPLQQPEFHQRLDQYRSIARA